MLNTFTTQPNPTTTRDFFWSTRERRWFRRDTTTLSNGNTDTEFFMQTRCGENTRENALNDWFGFCSQAEFDAR